MGARHYNKMFTESRKTYKVYYYEDKIIITFTL